MIYKLALLIAISLLSFTALAKEKYPGQYAQVSPEIQEFFKHYNRNGFNCCTIADCHILTADLWTIKEGSYWIYVKEWENMLKGDDTPWYKVPNEAVVLDQPNPTGGAIACYVTRGLSISFYCFTPGALF